MKLTKGKISKLYNKKKQSLKKVNKRKGSNKSKNKTFRRKRHINLARRSLKRIHYRKQRGGEEELPKDDLNKNTNEDLVVPETSETVVPETSETVVPETSETVVPETTTDVVVPETTTDVVVPETSDVVLPETTETVVLPETSETVVVPETTETVLPETSETVVVPETTTDVVVPETTTDVVLPETTRDVVVPETTTDVVVPETTTDVVVPETTLVPETSTTDSPLAGTQAVSIENNVPIDEQDIVKDKVKDALNAVADYISDKVSENISKNVEDAQIIKNTPEVNIQNGFDSVNKAVETITSTGGSKKRKTRKFRIQKPKKSKHHKTKKHIGGGEWINSRDASVVENVSCPICLENFLDTPNQAIYKSDCGHIFHNNCMLRVCEGPIEKRICPMCRTPLKDDCSDVYAFRHKAMVNQDDDDENAPVFEDEEIQTIYENQR
jgi:hypothetical protein